MHFHLTSSLLIHTLQTSDALKLKSCRQDGKVDYKNFLFLVREVMHDRLRLRNVLKLFVKLNQPILLMTGWSQIFQSK